MNSHVNRATDEGDCPVFRDITFEDIHVKGADCAGNIAGALARIARARPATCCSDDFARSLGAGFKGDLLEGLVFRNVTFETPPKDGWRCGYVDPKTFSAVGVSPPLECRPEAPKPPPDNCFA